MLSQTRYLVEVSLDTPVYNRLLIQTSELFTGLLFTLVF